MRYLPIWIIIIIVVPGLGISIWGCGKSWAPNKSAFIGTLYSFLCMLTIIIVLGMDQYDLYNRLKFYMLFISFSIILSIQLYFGYRALAGLVMGANPSSSRIEESKNKS